MQKLHLKINKKTAFHYLLIYFAICLNDSFIYYQIVSKYLIVFVGIGALLLLLFSKLRNQWVYIAGIILLVIVIMQRFATGGVGLNIYFIWIVHILFGFIAVLYDKENFLTRYIKIVVFLAVVSLFYYELSLINLDLAKKLTMIHLPYRTSVSSSITIDGLFLYCFNPWHYDRNTSIFGEPGLYQIVLNSALFCLLFIEDKNNLSKKKVIIYILILSLALISTRSTTGFIGFLLLLAGYIVEGKKKEKIGIRSTLLLLLILLATALLIDYQYNLSNSIIQTAFISKVFSENGTINILNSTGQYRFGTIELCLESIRQHPFGVGYDTITSILSTRKGLVAAKFLTTAAACGLQWTLFALIWLFAPIVKSNWSIVVKLLFILLFFNTALAQSQEFYTGFIMIICYAMVMCKEKGNNNESSLVHKQSFT